MSYTQNENEINSVILNYQWCYPQFQHQYTYYHI